MRVKDHVAFDIGYDMRRFGQKLPENAHAEIVNGWKLADNKYGKNWPKLNYHEKRWLQSRRSAFERGIYFSPHITPNYLLWMIDKKCPVTDRPLRMKTGSVMDASFDRVLNRYGYVHGNLVAMSVEANKAKDSKNLDEVRLIERKGHTYKGLSSDSWTRMRKIMEHAENSLHDVFPMKLEGEAYQNGLLYGPACQMQAFFTDIFAVSDDPDCPDSFGYWNYAMSCIFVIQRRKSSKSHLNKVVQDMYDKELHLKFDRCWEYWAHRKSRKLFFNWWDNLTNDEKSVNLSKINKIYPRPEVVTGSPTTEEFRNSFDMDSSYRGHL